MGALAFEPFGDPVCVPEVLAAYSASRREGVGLAVFSTADRVAMDWPDPLNAVEIEKFPKFCHQLVSTWSWWTKESQNETKLSKGIIPKWTETNWEKSQIPFCSGFGVTLRLNFGFDIVVN